MINCKKAGLLIEKNEFEKLNRFTRFKLKLHLAICKPCKKYYKDNSVLIKVIRLANFKHCDSCLTDEEKVQMKQKLADH